MTSSMQTARTAIWAALHTLQYGFHISALNGIQEAVTCSSTLPVGTHAVRSKADVTWEPSPCVQMTPCQFGLIVSVFTIGGLVGSLSANTTTARVGRIWVLRLSAISILIGAISIGAAGNISVMALGRLIIGFGCGLSTVSVPLFLSELAPSTIKGFMGIMNQLSIVFGILLAQSLAFPFAHPGTWRWVMMVSAGIAVIQLLGSMTVRLDMIKAESEVEPLLGDIIVVLVTQVSQQLCGISPGPMVHAQESARSVLRETHYPLDIITDTLFESASFSPMARSAPTPAPSGDVDKSILIADHGKPSYGAISHDTPVCGNAQRQKQQPTPLPVGQILVLSLTRMSEPLTFTVLFPFVNQMIVDTGQVAVENVGYTVGMVETSFSLTQIIFLLYWSRAADRYGRKPVLLFSLFGAFLASILFGFSTRVWHMYAARCLAGIFGGNAVVIRTLFAEVSDKTNQARAFSYFAFSASIGALIGPAIGGFLSRPAQEYPRQFGHVQLFIDYPYALPCLIAGLYVLLTMIAAHYWLEEPNRDVSPAPIAVRSILTPRIMSMLSIFGWTVTLSFSLSALIPLHLFTPVSLGGQGQTPSQIAQVVGASGFFQSLWLLIAMPKLDQLLGTRRLFIWTAAAYPVVMVLPVLASIAKQGKTEPAAHFENMEKARSLSSDNLETQHDVRGLDSAMEFLAVHGKSKEVSEAENKRVRFQIDMRVLPLMCMIYFFQQLDKSTLANSSIFGLKTDTHLVGTQYSWLGSIVYFAQLVFQPRESICSDSAKYLLHRPVSAYALVKLPTNVWLYGNFIGWGAILCCMAAAKNFAGLMATRFFLGAFEASIAPTFIIITAMWWTRREQVFRTNIWYSMNGIAAILGSLLAWGLGHAHSNVLHSYQLIFLTCGCLARFLNDDEKRIAIERLRSNNTGTQNTEWKWDQFFECLSDIKTWIWVAMSELTNLDSTDGAIGIASNLLSAWAITYFKIKSVVFFIVCLFPLAGAGALFALPRGKAHTQSLLGAYFVLNCYQCITAIIFSWSSANTAGHTKKTTNTAMLYVGLCVGNIVGPQLYRTQDAPEYHRGLTANLVVLSVLALLVVAQGCYLRLLNRRNTKRRLAVGKTGDIVDYSLASSSKWAGMRAEQAAKDEQEGKLGKVHGSNAFLDLTDLRNDEFQYSI
ncbi:MFS transporter, ACS family, allantoate permease, partial [Tremellales sp. Uapishka_1]